MNGRAVHERFPHLCILASAGSGKTFQLANRYLGLVAAGAPVGSILASTFTRIAAGEIRDRILLRLAEAADDPKERADLGVHIDVPGLDRPGVLALLRTVATHLHRMQIRTIDGFFGAVVRAFAIELGLPADGGIVEDDEAARVRAEAIGRMLEAHEARRVIVLLRALTQGQSDRSVMAVIDRVVTGLYELYREAPFEAWSRVARRRELTKGELEATLRVIEEAPVGKALRKARDADVAAARRGDWEGLLQKGIAAAVARGQETYSRARLEAGLLDAYRSLVAHALAAVVNSMRAQTEATRDVLALYDLHYRDARRRRRVMTFADVTAAMESAYRTGTIDDICFRIDAAIHHLLLDEFQDTSAAQWRALRPLAAEIVGDESRARTFFCVGDGKQSIYGWRDACPEVLSGIPDLLPAPGGGRAVRQDGLTKSWRSAPAVIDVVNRVFGTLEDNAALGELRDGGALFAQVFAEHQTAKGDLAGAVELRTAPRATGGEDQDVVRLREAARLVRSLLDRRPRCTVAVLTRTNQAVSRVLFELQRDEVGVRASGWGGGPVTDMPAVNAVLDLLRLADHPGDTVAAFNVAGGPLGPVVELADALSAEERQRVARSLRRSLVEEGYARSILDLALRIAPACDEAEYRRLLQLVDLAAAHEARSTLRPGDFVRIAEQRPVASAVPAQVQVMTVHQSKGLEFDAVVLPDLEGKLTGAGPPPVVFEREGAAGDVARICRWMNRQIRAPLEELAPLFDGQVARTVRESLCVLYVAMTRARQGLSMLIDPPGLLKGGGPSPTIPQTTAGVLRWALAGAVPPPAGAVIYRHGEDDWLERAGGERETDAEPAVRPEPPLPIRLAPPAGDISRGVAAAPSSARGLLALELKVHDREPRDRGTALHALFEQVEWIEDFEPAEPALLRVVRRTAPRRGDRFVQETLRLFREAIERPEVRACLGRRGRRAAISRERRFARIVPGTLPGEERLQQGAIDRLVVEHDDRGRPCAAEVIDFKTDDVTAEEAIPHAESYRGQMESYRAVAASLTGLDEARVAATLLFVRPGTAVEMAAGTGAPAPRASTAAG